MDILITIAGLIIGASVFLYALSFLESGKRKLSEPRVQRSSAQPSLTSLDCRQTEKKNVSPISAASQLSEDLKGKMPERLCPMCGKTLTRDEPLYATHMDVGTQRKVFIHGCPYCYKNNDKKKQGA